MKRHVVAVVATVATVAAAVVGTATNALAAPGRTHQGGCSTYSARGIAGYSIGVCIDDRGSGTTAYPDIYVNAVPRGQNCKIDIETWGIRNDKHGDTAITLNPCRVGHYVARPVAGSATTPLHAFARLWVNGQQHATGNSPEISVSPNTNAGLFYDYDFIAYRGVGRGSTHVRSTPANALKELHKCFNCTFPVSGAPRQYPTTGQTLPLFVDTVFGHLNAPVLAYPYDRQNMYIFTAKPGHFEGEGAEVAFRFFTDSGGFLHLEVSAYGSHPTIPAWAAKAGAYNEWSIFAGNLGTNLVRDGLGH